MRTDDKFSQKVRNLKSHDALEKRGFATFIRIAMLTAKLKLLDGPPHTL